MVGVVLPTIKVRIGEWPWAPMTSIAPGVRSTSLAITVSGLPRSSSWTVLPTISIATLPRSPREPLLSSSSCASPYPIDIAQTAGPSPVEGTFEIEPGQIDIAGKFDGISRLAQWSPEVATSLIPPCMGNLRIDGYSWLWTHSKSRTSTFAGG
jgi:hypothetical protein